MSKFLRKHWKKALGVAVAIAGVFYPPALAVTIPIGTAIAGSDFQIGAQMGTPIGQAAKDFARKVNGK
jgi:hypothetical protein